jgi:hypothetical protein
MSRIDWPEVLARGAAIVAGYESRVTLRQLHYRLVSEGLYPNTTSAYKRLSSLTAKLRRDGSFPDLFDRGRVIHRAASWTGPDDALGALVGQYRRDRTAGQAVTVYLAVEKAGLVELVSSWFDHLGLPVLALGGYSSQSYVDMIARDAHARGRPAALLYAGDFDPSGLDIERDFVERAGCFDKVQRVALTGEQIDEYDLPPLPGKATDSRAAAFTARTGRLVQVEVDALDPDVLRRLFATSLADWWDDDAYDRALAREQHDVAQLREAWGVIA